MRQTLRTMRQDAWTSEDDAILAEIVLRHIRDGSTQLAGFNEASRRLGRTAAACGFRWNACVRKQQRNIIEVAKEERKDKKAERVQAQLEGGDLDHPTATLMSWAQVLRFLRQEKNTAGQWASRWRNAERQCSEWKQRFAELEREHRKQTEAFRNMRQEYETVVNDYRALVQIMERVRKATVLSDETTSDGFLYKIDENGNLERLSEHFDIEQAE
ncbi:MAG: RsfA family transcriptional regulator [Alicyclobacillaceae bacterium]|jgi:prespore-specific regulator|uniref:RsfA family transcriptional regulator n=1 Tax=Alicyclobacillus sp. SP_1 TaxID=2942475 RepID=UPI002157F784|nr:RsfA family transcriptional regulator [Alicyclobacillus sp. SP_1]MCY0886994.1 RsfA family transcriptional regulator [Alicyclobacillaceae bacterium]MCY0897170.1 RsfA family transcriptional regulator [Alicyclobacillaceae bacterium]